MRSSLDPAAGTQLCRFSPFVFPIGVVVAGRSSRKKNIRAFFLFCSLCRIASAVSCLLVQLIESPHFAPRKNKINETQVRHCRGARRCRRSSREGQEGEEEQEARRFRSSNIVALPPPPQRAKATALAAAAPAAQTSAEQHRRRPLRLPLLLPGPPSTPG